MNKNFIILLLICFTTVSSVSSQIQFPTFLVGTWKVENKENYEHWYPVNDTELRGVSYTVVSGQKQINEHVRIFKHEDKIIYSALVIGQNNGKEVNFELTLRDSTYSFINNTHDYPNRIAYTKMAVDRMAVVVEGKTNRNQLYYVNKIESDTATDNKNYDVNLATKLGSDDYGMKSYIFVILKTGPNKTASKDLITKSFQGHMENINRLVERGQLIVAGPFRKNDADFRGLFILNHIYTVDEAKALLQTDPAIKHGLLEPICFSWYGSAALSEYLPLSDKIWKKQH
jgi:uncharacterized protein YciI